MNVNACDGRCCAAFFFPSNPREIKDKIDRYGEYNGLDGMMIANMLIPLSPDEVKERTARFGLNPQILNTPEDHVFTCKHWNEETRECGVYEARPDMCATYPYGRSCEHCDCEGGCENGPGWRKVSKED